MEYDVSGVTTTIDDSYKDLVKITLTDTNTGFTNSTFISKNRHDFKSRLMTAKHNLAINYLVENEIPLYDLYTNEPGVCCKQDGTLEYKESKYKKDQKRNDDKMES